MNHLKVRQKYSAARRIFNYLLGVSSADETLRLMLDIFLQYRLSSSPGNLANCMTSRYKGRGYIMLKARIWTRSIALDR